MKMKNAHVLENVDIAHCISICCCTTKIINVIVSYTADKLESGKNILSQGKLSWLVGWLCFTSHRQRGHLETAPPFTVPCEGSEAR